MKKFFSLLMLVNLSFSLASHAKPKGACYKNIIIKVPVGQSSSQSSDSSTSNRSNSQSASTQYETHQIKTCEYRRKEHCRTNEAPIQTSGQEKIVSITVLGWFQEQPCDLSQL